MWWKKVLDVLVGAGFFEKVLDKLPGVEKMSEGEKAQFQLAMQQAVTDAAISQEKQLQDFFIAYEGSAVDMPRFVQIMRGIIRPAITLSSFYGLLLLMLILIYDPTLWATPLQQEMVGRLLNILYVVNLIVLTFWFGEKIIRKSGILEIFNKKVQDKDNGQE